MIAINFLFKISSLGCPLITDSTHHLVKTLHPVPPLQDVQREAQHGNDTGPCNAKRKGAVFINSSWVRHFIIGNDPCFISIPQPFLKKKTSLESRTCLHTAPQSIGASKKRNGNNHYLHLVTFPPTSRGKQRVVELPNNNSNRVNLRLQASNINQCW